MDAWTFECGLAGLGEFVVFVALDQLAIGTTLLTAAFLIGFGASGLAFVWAGANERRA